MTTYSLTQTRSLALFFKPLYFYFLFQFLQTTGEINEREQLNTLQENLLVLQSKIQKIVVFVWR